MRHINDLSEIESAEVLMELYKEGQKERSAITYEQCFDYALRKGEDEFWEVCKMMQIDLIVEINFMRNNSHFSDIKRIEVEVDGEEFKMVLITKE